MDVYSFWETLCETQIGLVQISRGNGETHTCYYDSWIVLENAVGIENCLDLLLDSNDICLFTFSKTSFLRSSALDVYV